MTILQITQATKVATNGVRVVSPDDPKLVCNQRRLRRLKEKWHLGLTLPAHERESYGIRALFFYIDKNIF